MSLSDNRLITRDEASFEELRKRPTIFIVGHRQSGKTQALIELSEQTGIPILAPTRMMRDCIELQAERQGRTIPAPQVYKPADFPPIQEQDRKNPWRNVYADEMQKYFADRKYTSGYITLNLEDVSIETFKESNPTLRQVLRMWWQARKERKQ